MISVNKLNKSFGELHILKDINELYVYTVNEGDVLVGRPLILHISDFELPDGASISDSSRGVSIEIERIY